MIKYLIAMPREAKMLRQAGQIPEGEICITGIGAIILPETTPHDILVNVGYAGGHLVGKGTIVEPEFVVSANTGHARYIDKIFKADAHCRCYTCSGFQTEPIRQVQAVYDMELFKIMQLPHKKIYALKIVSDSLDEAECESYEDAHAWARVAQMLEVLNGVRDKQ